MVSRLTVCKSTDLLELVRKLVATGSPRVLRLSSSGFRQWRSISVFPVFFVFRWWWSWPWRMGYWWCFIIWSERFGKWVESVEHIHTVVAPFCRLFSWSWLFCRLIQLFCDWLKKLFSRKPANPLFYVLFNFIFRQICSSWSSSSGFSCASCCHFFLYNPSYSRILIRSRLWSIRGQTHDWRHHYKVLLF